MSFTPAFEIGLWNAWIFWIVLFFSMIIPNLFMIEEAKTRTKRAAQFIPFKKKKEKIFAYATHMLIMPCAIIYSVFLPLKTGTTWFYTGLVIFLLSIAMNLMATISYTTSPVDKPVTRGIYRISRHPIYLSGFLVFAGIGIAAVSWIILPCAILWFTLFHLVYHLKKTSCSTNTAIPTVNL